MNDNEPTSRQTIGIIAILLLLCGICTLVWGVGSYWVANQWGTLWGVFVGIVTGGITLFFMRRIWNNISDNEYQNDSKGDQDDGLLSQRRQLLQQFIEQETWLASYQFAHEHPELLEETNSLLLLLSMAQDGIDGSRMQILSEHLDLLQACRTYGLTEAFATKLGISSQQLEQATTQPQAGDSQIPAELLPLLNELTQLSYPHEIPRKIELLQQALQRVSRISNPLIWAALQGDLATSVQQNPLGDRAENIEQAIQLYEQALLVMTRDAMPTEWADMIMSLANAYYSRIRGERAENIEQTILLVEQALQVRVRAAMPTEWAQSTNNLAVAYVSRIRGERAENIEQAIQLYEQALQVRTRAIMPTEWAQSTNNLAVAYRNRIRGERAENIEQAIQLYEQALQVRTRAAMPNDWATCIMNLGNAYRNRIRGERAENIEQAIQLYEQALEVRTQTAMPIEWAEATMNLAAAYSDRIRGERAENIEQAIQLYEQALQVRTQTAIPIEWAEATMNLANAYKDRIRGERAENIEQAIQLYEQALEVRTQTAMPIEWAEATMNLANAYKDRIRGERAENIEQAIRHYEAALQVMTHIAMPTRWAQATNNLANAYQDRIQGERAQNIEQAIQLYEQALQVMTRAAMPTEWATATMNLANAYKDRIRGERAENIEQAIQLYEQSLQVRTETAMPIEWAEAIMNLANAYYSHIRGERAENIEQAIQLYEQALEVRTQTAMPIEWAEATMNLANAYYSRIRGERAENIEQAIRHYEAALQVMTRAAMPAGWAKTTMNLANAYYSRIRGERAENIEQAIRHYEATLQVMTRAAMPTDWAGTTNNLVNAYKDRIRGDRAQNIEQAIQLCEQALQVMTRTDMPIRWAQATNNLANAYQDRIQGERAQNIEQAIQLYEQALQVMTRAAMPTEWAETTMNLATAYSNRIRGEQAQNIEQAIQLYEQALGIFTLAALPADHQLCQSNLGNLYFGEGQWAKSLVAYAGAIEANKLLLDSAASREGQLAEVGEVSTLFARTAYALFHLGRVGEALVQLDAGKARLLALAVGQEEAQLERLTEAEQALFSQARTKFSELQLERQLPPGSPGRRPDSELAPLQERAINQLNATIAQLRAAHPDFMPEGLGLTELLALIPTGGAMIAPVVTSHGGGVLVVPHGTQEPTAEHYLPLPQLTEERVGQWVIGTEEEQGWLRIYIDYLNNRQRTLHDLAGWQPILNELNQHLLTPLQQKLAELDIPHGAELLLMPQGRLGLLPLHQFWLDEYTVRYAPSGYAVQASLRRAENPPQTNLEQRSRLLAVVNPTGDLPFTPYEGEAVAGLFAGEKTVYREQEGRLTAVLPQLSQHDYLHFSCHGNFGWGDSDQTGLSLAHGERLTLRDILTHRLRPARLVTLSACETGMTDVTKAADEFLGLPAAFLQAGAIGVVGTLWAVNDLSTTLLMEQFYTLHLGGMTPAQALRQAQIWLRDVSAGEVGAWAKSKYEVTPSAELFRRWRYGEAEPETRPFADPYFWAGFTFSGI